MTNDKQAASVQLMTPIAKDAWRKYALLHSKSGPMHLVEWYDVLRTASSVKPLFLMAKTGEEIAGILPLYFSRSLLVGRHVASLHGAFLADSSQVAMELQDEAMRLATGRKAKFLLLREPGEVPLRPNAWHTAARSIVELQAGAEQLWSRLSSNTRRKARKAAKNGYSVDRPNEWVDEFYPIYAARMRQLGTPVQAKSFFSAIQKHLRQVTIFFRLRQGSQMIGGQLAIMHNDSLWSMYVASDIRHMRSYANYQLYWSSIEWACMRGLKQFDLGRSVIGSGNNQFKKLWASNEQQVTNDYFSTGMPVDPHKANLHRESSLKQKVWSRLPLSITNTIGPFLRKQLPFS
jgi:CelD/BcsL family acetyltransferase involved in cellulose biosynthesis